jgi:predicted ArsR family transcriptional regulator
VRNNIGRESERVTIRQAATLLGVHPNTVRNHVKAGMYQAEKVLTERGETWMIDRNSLITSTPASASQQVGNPQAMTFAQELLRPFVTELGEVREQLGAERARREMAERERDELRRELDELRGLEAAAEETAQEIHRRVDEQQETPESPADEQQGRGPIPHDEDPQTPSERRSWWRRFFP